MADAVAAAGSVRASRSRSRGEMLFARMRRHKGLLIGAGIFVCLCAIAVAQNVVAPQNPIKIDIVNTLQPPSAAHWMGTDEIGRDVFSRVVHGARISLSVGAIAVVIGAAVGTVVGLVAGFAGGPVDAVTMRIIDVMLAFPGVLLALGIVSVLGPNLQNVMIAVGISGIPFYARLVRSTVLVAREQLYVEAARVIGVPLWLLLFRHVLPNIVAPIIVAASLNMGGTIIAAAGLSFVGLGSQPPTPEWGRMLTEGRDYLRDAWWITTFPGVAIMITVLSVNLLGDGLRDVLDPRLRI